MQATKNIIKTSLVCSLVLTTLTLLEQTLEEEKEEDRQDRQGKYSRRSDPVSGHVTRFGSEVSRTRK